MIGNWIEIGICDRVTGSVYVRGNSTQCEDDALSSSGTATFLLLKMLIRNSDHDDFDFN